MCLHESMVSMDGVWVIYVCHGSTKNHVWVCVMMCLRSGGSVMCWGEMFHACTLPAHFFSPSTPAPLLVLWIKWSSQKCSQSMPPRLWFFEELEIDRPFKWCQWWVIWFIYTFIIPHTRAPHPFRSNPTHDVRKVSNWENGMEIERYTPVLLGWACGMIIMIRQIVLLAQRPLVLSVPLVGVL